MEAAMRIAVVGTGGAGGYFGGLLAQSGEDVHFVARGEHLKAIQANGLRVTSIHGDFHVNPAQATDDPKTIGPVDLVLFAVKTYHTQDAVKLLPPLLGPQTAILPLQNGVESTEMIAAAVGQEHALGGACWVASAVTAPGKIDQKSEFRRIVLGELSGQVSDRVAAITEALKRSGATAEASSEINKVRWTKFVFIASFSGMGSAARVPAGPLRGCPETRVMLEAAMGEIAALAAASGVRLDDDVVAKTMAFVDSMAPGTTASMQRDIFDGKPSELEAQNGFIARRGAELGVPVPVNTFLYHILLPQERVARGQA
jgi:2-dehydropantoate 2-reductase